MPQPSRREREDARRRETAAAGQRRRAGDRKKRILAGTIALVVLLSTVGAGIAATRGTTTSSATTSSTRPPTTTGSTLPTRNDYPATGIEPVPAVAGTTLTGPTPCPATDGSAERTTSFAEAPPMCIDTGRFYRAVVNTTAGPLTFQLNPRLAPQSTNAFVVLATYGYYDGQPIRRIEPTAWFEAGGRFADGAAPTGFEIPNEAPVAGQIFTAGTIAMIGENPTSGPDRGAFLVATFENAPTIDQGVSSFGILLDGASTLVAIDRLGSRDGLPARPVRIDSVTVTPGVPIP